MRIVEQEKDTTTVAYRTVWGLAWVSAAFSIIVAVLLVANHIQVTRLDPVHSPALEQLLQQLKASPQDQALREEIRDLDLLARRAFFNSQQFNRLAIFLLLGGLAVLVVTLKTLRAYRPAPPYPNAREPKEEPMDRARWARESITAVGLILLGLALVVALPWRSPLDEPASNGKAADAGIVTVPDAPAVPKTMRSLSPAARDFPSREEREKNWPGFLGAAGGAGQAHDIPVAWDAATGVNVRWQVEIPRPGFGSPVIWGNRVFLAGADETSQEIFALHAATGALLWRKLVRVAPLDEALTHVKVTADAGYAASTPATDGTRVFAIFASGDLAAFDYAGEELWTRHLGWPDNPYGYASSPVVFEDLLIVQFDRKQESFVTGLDVATGEPRWQTPRTFGPSWSSPRLIETEQGPQLLTAADPSVVAYDPRTGGELWRIDCLKGAEVACSPAYAQGVIYVGAEYNQLTAIDAAAKEILWRRADVVPGIGTPLIAQGSIFFGLSESGIVCLDAATGDIRWETQTEEIFYASPLLVEDRIYLADRGGTVHIFAADGASYRLLGQPTIGEEIVSSPAVSGDGLFCRGIRHLFCLGSKP